MFHLSIDVDDPCRVARVLAHLMGGHASPSPRFARGAWRAHADNGWGSMIEVHPRGGRRRIGDLVADAPCLAEGGEAMPFAIGTAFDPEDVFQLAAEEGWPACYARRDGCRAVIELRIEPWLKVDVMTPAMQADYVAAAAGRRAREAVPPYSPVFSAASPG